MKYLLLLSVLILISCTASPKLSPDIIYKYDMRMSVNGKTAHGIMAVPTADKYNMKIKAAGRLDMFFFTTCHREMAKEKAWDSGWFKSKHKAEFDYEPMPGLEKDTFCPVHMIGAEMSQGRHSWGYIDFISKDTNLDAELYCNGEYEKFTGVSVCQSREGLLQKIAFDRPVNVNSLEKNCLNEWEDRDKKVWEFDIARGICIYIFMDLDGNLHRMTTIGYEQVPIRE